MAASPPSSDSSDTEGGEDHAEPEHNTSEEHEMPDVGNGMSENALNVPTHVSDVEDDIDDEMRPADYGDEAERNMSDHQGHSSQDPNIMTRSRSGRAIRRPRRLDDYEVRGVRRARKVREDSDSENELPGFELRQSSRVFDDSDADMDV